MGYGIEIRIDSTRAIKKLQKLQTKLDKRELLRFMGVHVLYWIDHNFQDEGTEGKWKSLSAATLARRRKSGVDAKILQDTGRLKSSFVQGRKGNTFLDFENKVIVGSEDPRAEWHHKGTYTKKGNIHIPSRPILPSAKVAQKVAEKALRAYVDVIIASVGGK